MSLLIDKLLILTKKPDAPGAPDSKQPLIPGRVIKATVLGPGPGGAVKLRMLGATVLARTNLDLPPGQVLELTVQSAGPEPVLTINDPAPPSVQPLPPPGEGMGQVLRMLLHGRERMVRNLARILDFKPPAGLSPRAQKAIAKFQEMAASLLLDRAGASDPAALGRLVSRSGMGLEARLAALAKGGAKVPEPGLRQLAMELAGILEAEMGALPSSDMARAAVLSELLLATRGLAEVFTANQQVNAELYSQRYALIFALPLLFGDKLEYGEVLMELGREGPEGKEEKELRLSFLLNLASLGPLAIEAGLEGKYLSARLTTHSDEKAGFISTRLPALKKALAVGGFMAQLSCRALPAPEVEALSPLAGLIRQGGQYLSLTV